MIAGCSSNQLGAIYTAALNRCRPIGETLLTSSPRARSNTLPCQASQRASHRMGRSISVPGATTAVPRASPSGISPSGLRRNRSSSSVCDMVVRSSRVIAMTLPPCVSRSRTGQARAHATGPDQVACAGMADLARVLLAVVRLVNGFAALAVPQLLARNVGIDPEENPAVLYVLRMFGIRTVLIGLDLLSGGERRAQALRVAPLIHGSDTLAAFLAAQSGRFPKPAGWLVVGISAFNTLLALLAKR